MLFSGIHCQVTWLEISANSPYTVESNLTIKNFQCLVDKFKIKLKIKILLKKNQRYIGKNLGYTVIKNRIYSWCAKI